MPITEEEKQELIMIAGTLLPGQIAETLTDLIVRERSLLESDLDADMRSITLHNIAVLTAAALGYEESSKSFEALSRIQISSPKTEK